jgi:hypothetical protein
MARHGMGELVPWTWTVLVQVAKLSRSYLETTIRPVWAGGDTALAWATANDLELIIVKDRAVAGFAPNQHPYLHFQHIETKDGRSLFPWEKKAKMWAAQVKSSRVVPAAGCQGVNASRLHAR